MDWKHSINSCVKKVIYCGYTKKTELGFPEKYLFEIRRPNGFM